LDSRLLATENLVAALVPTGAGNGFLEDLLGFETAA
jgi:hypothetical protein